MKIGRLRTLRSTKSIEKGRKALIANVSYASIALLVLTILVIAISWLPFIRIQSIKVDGIEDVSEESIKSIANTFISGNYGYILPRSSIFLYTKSEIKETILKDISKIKDVEIDVDGLTELNITISERHPDVMVCEGFREDENNDTCYYADTDGIVYEKAPILTDGVYYKYFVTSNSKGITVGEPFIDLERFNQLQDFVSGLNSSKVVSTGMLISEDGSYELYINNIKEGTAVVYFDDRTPFDKTMSNLITFWNNALDKKIGTTTISNFEYINLRFGNNVFYLTK